MSPSPSSWWSILAQTPLTDLVRGRLTAALDWRQLACAAKLPQDAVEVVETVVRKTRLWRKEKCDVALELSAHFRDGLAQGQSAARLVQDFGDPTQAARLIRRAKKRNRSWAWKASHRCSQALGVFCLVYLGLIAVSVSRHPSPAVDYLASVNAVASAAPAADSAWPLYRVLWADYTARGLDSRQVEARPGDPGWEATREVLSANAAWLGELRNAAAKPAFGLPVGFSWDFSPEDARVLFGEDWKPGSPPAKDDPERLESECLAHVLLPHLARLKSMAQWLAADMAAAAESGDGQRVVDDFQAILGVAHHNREHPFLINELVSLAVVAIGETHVARVLHDWPESLSDGELTQLAHALATSIGRLGVDFSGERLMFLDIVQRVYSDDGDGDGHVTLEGMRLLRQLGLGPEAFLGEEGPSTSGLLLESSDLGARAAVAAVAPVTVQLLASRREMLLEHNRLMTLMEAEAAQPLWVQLHQPSEAEREMAAIGSSPAQSLRYLQITTLLHALGGAGNKSAESVAFSEVLMVATALELYHRQAGAYPENLAELAPRWLPRVPPDASTGQPLLFRLVEGRPVLYGRGWNGLDNGGLMTEKAAKAWPRMTSDGGDPGDWVLYPPPERSPAKG